MDWGARGLGVIVGLHLGGRRAFAVARRTYDGGTSGYRRRLVRKGVMHSAPQYPDPMQTVRVGSADIALYRFDAFRKADFRRAVSLVTECGVWMLPEPLATASGSAAAVVEWVHDTHELLLLCGVPKARPDKVVGTLAFEPQWGSGGMRVRSESLRRDSLVAVVGLVPNRIALWEVLRGTRAARETGEGVEVLIQRLATPTT